MTDVAERTQPLPGDAKAPSPRHAAGMAPEPATPRALWPTFMRRTLAEEMIRPAHQPLPSRPSLPEA